jgi:heme/copper-type cytochrome/quinol oxidase subunit 1
VKFLTDKPYLIFWLSIPIIILIGFLSGTEPLDINLHDTYYVIEHGFISILISIIFGILGFGYWIMQKTNRRLSKWLNLTHIVLTIGGLLLIRILLQLFRELETESLMSDFHFNENLNIAMFIIALIVIFGQIVYPINIIRGIILKRNKTSG